MEKTRLSEVTQAQKDKYRMWSLTQISQLLFISFVCLAWSLCGSQETEKGIQAVVKEDRRTWVKGQQRVHQGQKVQRREEDIEATMRQGREEQSKQGCALKAHMETYYPVAPSFKKEGLEGDAICGYIMFHHRQ